ncbi:MAG: hypothetical protein LBF85_05480 [Tannerella sp.]|jgi:uncharacterized membrane protein|nr:hypothetical protein [Tannerella sp.]
MANVTSTPDKDAEDNKVYAVLSYFWILFLIPLLAAKESPFARFHANQGFILFIVNFVLMILLFIPFIGFVALIVNIGTFVLMIIGIINAAKGEKKELPLIGNLFQIIK